RDGHSNNERRTRPSHECCPPKTRRSDADALSQELSVIGGIAEQQLGRLRTLEVEMCVMLPREADPAVDLDVLGGGVEVSVGAVGLGQTGDDRELIVELSGSPSRVVRRRLGRLD